IGDRKFDCHAARNLGLKSIGVLYGFGSLAELQACNPDGLCERPEELLRVIGDSCSKMQLEVHTER
ncbi:MAG: HAD hydrolase-like protein, partial [Oligoflexia bacterium]